MLCVPLDFEKQNDYCNKDSQTCFFLNHSHDIPARTVGGGGGGGGGPLTFRFGLQQPSEPSIR